MNRKLMHKYASFLVRDCLKLKKGQPILISGITLNQDFVNIVVEEAKKIGSLEVKTLLIDRAHEREMFLTKTYEECIASPSLNRDMYNEIALKGGALLSLSSPIPHINDGVDPVKLQKLSKEIARRTAIFRERQTSGLVPWCIAAVPNQYWAEEILPEADGAEEKLWDYIFDICKITSENPVKKWEVYFAKLDERCRILNEMQIKSLHYESSNGTDFIIELPKNYVFQSAKNADFIVNMPSLELFTTPRKDGVNGIVYSSKPLFYNGVLIEDFSFQVEHGRIVSYSARKNEAMLASIIEADEGSHYFGELALVDYDSPINQSGIVFQNTLYDENASCHLAIGRGFPKCFLNGLTKTKEELEKMGMNSSSKHVDFMIGTRDLKITARLENGTEVIIMENGLLKI